jgi:hypothetical protein
VGGEEEEEGGRGIGRRGGVNAGKGRRTWWARGGRGEGIAVVLEVDHTDCDLLHHKINDSFGILLDSQKGIATRRSFPLVFTTPVAAAALREERRLGSSRATHWHRKRTAARIMFQEDSAPELHHDERHP